MFLFDAFGLFVGAVALGFVHGVEPGHGWPVAASYALDRSNKWLAGLAAGLVLGLGHLVSSIAMVAVFFLAADYFDLTQVNDPLSVLGFQIGGPVSIVAGVVLIALGIREYRGHGHSHGHGDDGHSHDAHSHGHSHGETDDDHNHADVSERVRGQLGEAPLGRPGTGESHSDDGRGHGHDNEHSRDGGWLARLKRRFGRDHSHSYSHSHGDMADASDRGILGLAWFAFLLGFAHEEEFEIIALCAGSTYCLELMTAYAVTVIVGIVGLTLLLVAGYEHYEEEVERLVPYLPTISAVVLVGMGLGFVVGLF